MIEDAFLGPAAPDLGWVPAPRYLLRRARILRQLDTLAPGRLLEVGPGAGMLLVEAARRGFRCAALELSAGARTLAAAVIARSGQRIPVHAEADPGWEASFDALFAFDVLEHIERDREALAQWHGWLAPGGTLLLSVPAHARLWTAGDEWAGHFRRYERGPLLQLLRETGFEPECVECYGFPLTNLSERLSARIYARRIHRHGAAQDDRQRNNDRSGTDRGPHLRLYPLLSSAPGKLALRACCGIQHWFVDTDLGSGYLVKARRA
ncbi:MAG: class I SAM-dependent methyltransferase [Xanthomonadaceae bacterium]|nr:class I SAM-dependent methyltransferase [Xanthomonadaceae bacterium]